MRGFIWALLITRQCFSTAALSPAKPMTLRYFDAKGAAEISRVLLAMSDLEYEDERFEIGAGMIAPVFKAEKEGGKLSINLGRVPILRTPEGEIGQSKAIERYVASIGGLMGKTPFETSRIDMIAEHVRDIRDAQRSKGFSMFNRDKTEEEKAKLRDEWFSSDLPSWLEKLENCVVSVVGGSACHAVGNCASYADVCIWALLREAPKNELPLIEKAAKSCTTLKCIADAVASNPKVHNWLESRPDTAF